MGKNNSRRYFLGNLIKGGCASLSMIPTLSSLTNLQLFNAAANANKSLYGLKTGRKALVCLMLNGGNDSYNMLVPRNNTNNGYEDYSNKRGNLALASDSLHPLNPKNSLNYDFGFHEALPRMANLFNNDKASIIANIGPSAVHYEEIDLNNPDDFPLGLYSHSDQKQHWQTSMTQDRNADGWFARMTEFLYDSSNYDHRFMNISLAGNNIIQKGGSVRQFPLDLISESGVVGLRPGNSNLNPNDFLRNEDHHKTRLGFIDNLLELNHNNLLDKALKNTVRDALDLSTYYDLNIANNISTNDLSIIDNSFSEDTLKTSIGKQLKTVTKTLSNSLDLSHQTFYVELNGFDHHDKLLDNHQILMSHLDNAVGDFYNALENLGLSNEVVLFTVSDFARKLISNGDGSDHGWGGNCLIVGGNGEEDSILNGRKILGEFPDLADTNLCTGGGRFIPTTSCDEYFADLALWFGASTSDLDTILPNLSSFDYDLNEGLGLFG